MDLLSVLVGIGIFCFGIVIGNALSCNSCCDCCADDEDEDDYDKATDISIKVGRTCGPKCKCRE